MDRTQYILGKSPISSAATGLSLAATWAWGVSIVVGTAIAAEKGIAAFAIWGTANALALTVFWILTRKSPKNAISPIHFLGAIESKVYLVFMLMIQFFSILVNITAIRLACQWLGLPGWAWIPLVAIITIPVFIWGFGSVIKNNLTMFGLFIAMLFFGSIASWSGMPEVKIASSTGDIWWAIYGAVILLAGPIVDQQTWQRRAAFLRDSEPSVLPFAIASGLFFMYMALVGVAAYVIESKELFGMIILVVAASTLASAVSAICSIPKDNGIGIFIAGAWLLGAMAFAILAIPIITIWVVYGTLRVPLAAYLVYRIQRP